MFRTYAANGFEANQMFEVRIPSSPPLAVPYLLIPAGIVVLVTISAEAGSVGLFSIVIGLLALVIGIDVVVFRWAKQVSAHLDESRMLVTEKVFGFLLAALAVQLTLDGLAGLGVIHL